MCFAQTKSVMEYFTPKTMFINSSLLLIYLLLVKPGQTFSSSHYGVSYSDKSQQRVGGSGRDPRIISTGQRLRVALGDRITLPCQVNHIGNYVVYWHKGTDMLTARDMMVKPDPRMRLDSNQYNLQIKNIKETDAGDYTCKVAVMGQPIYITHTLEILVPPTIQAVPIDGNYVVKKGRKVELKCKAEGNPEPTITWSRLNNLLPSGEKRKTVKTLVIDSVDRHEAGIYICEATNGVGVSHVKAEAKIKLQVLYPPEIELETDRVHSGDNKEAHLTCLIHGNPAPTVRWYKDSMLLEETDTIRMTSRSNRHTLVLSSIKSGQDFGNYSCVAENTLGTFKKHIEVHGRPTPAVFRSSPEAGGKSTYHLTWTVDSYSPIIEYRLLYRQIQAYHRMNDGRNFMGGGERHGGGGGDWTNVIIPGDAIHASGISSATYNHRQSYEVSNLRFDAEYECLVQARNKFGWSEASRIFRFFTGKNEPTVYDLEWKSGATVPVASTSSVILISIGILTATALASSINQ